MFAVGDEVSGYGMYGPQETQPETTHSRRRREGKQHGHGLRETTLGTVDASEEVGAAVER